MIMLINEGANTLSMHTLACTLHLILALFLSTNIINPGVVVMVLQVVKIFNSAKLLWR